MTSLLEVALDYARQGRPVFPCDPAPDPKKPDRPRKRPLIEGGFKAATTDETQIRLWWERHPGALIGMPTGRASGIAVLDLDREVDPLTGEVVKDGEAALKKIMMQNGWELPESVEARTARGGRHIWFEHEDGFSSRANTLAPHVDTRADGGYVIVPPSKGLVGNAWEFKRSELVAPIAKAPAWLAEGFRTGKFLPPRVAVPAVNSDRLHSIEQPNLDDLRKALAKPWWDYDNREDWILAAHALKSVRDGMEIWEAWASQSFLYDPEETLSKWADTVPDRGITYLYIFGRVPRETLKQWKREREAAEPVRISATPFNWDEAAALPPRQWLYGRHLIRKFVSATVAPGGLGKSSLGIVDALAMVTGRSLIGVEPKGRFRVWLWNGEDPLEETQRRVLAASMLYGINPAELDGRLFVDSGRDQAITIAWQDRSGFSIAEPVVEALKAAIIERGIDVMVVDPFVSSHRVSENDNGAIDAVAKTWADIANSTGCAVELVHHSRKTGGAEVTAEHARGASALVSAARSVRVLNQMTSDEAIKAGIKGQHRGYFSVEIGKANLAPPADNRSWFRLVSVDLFNGNETQAGDCIGVVEAWEYPKAEDILSEDTVQAIQVALAGRCYRKDAQAADWAGHAIAAVLGLGTRAPEGAESEDEMAERMRNREQVKGVIKYMLKEGVLVERQQVDAKGILRPVLAVAGYEGPAPGAPHLPHLTHTLGVERVEMAQSSLPHLPHLPSRWGGGGGGEARREGKGASPMEGEALRSVFAISYGLELAR